ncbi:MAG: methenyltetrahydrofolate cyclohydrolase [Chloroflexi bacterium]|nr:methenyltetrahydrofolate cyclohydrolase [Chloroflexota bacterium]
MGRVPRRRSVAGRARRYRVRPVSDLNGRGRAGHTIARVEPQPARSSRPARDLTLSQYTDLLASGLPVPGGGSAAAVAAALGASLVSMVARLCEGRPVFDVHQATIERGLGASEALRARFLAIADEDADAYAALTEARRLPRGTDEERAARAQAVSAAAKHAAEVPYECVRLCLEVVSAAESLAGRSNANASSDLGVAVLLAAAAGEAAAANVYANLPSVNDQAWAGGTRARVVELLSAIEDLAQMTRETVAAGDQRPPLDDAG